MVPFSAQPYFGDLSPFDASGAGTGEWDRIFYVMVLTELQILEEELL